MNQILHDSKEEYKDDDILVSGNIFYKEKWKALPFWNAYQIDFPWYETVKRMCSNFFIKDTGAVVYYSHFYAVYEEGGWFYQVDMEVFP